MTASDVDVLLDPEITELLAVIPPLGVINAANLEATRRSRRAMVEAIALSDAVERTTITVPGGQGDPDVALRILRPRGVDGLLACVYWVHGGGFVMGTADQDDIRFDK